MIKNTPQKLYGQEWHPKYLHFMACALAMSMLVNQMLALKTVDFWGFYTVASTITYPLSLVVCDILTEVYGFKRTRQLIYTCLGFYVVCMLLTQLVVILPPSPDYALNDAYVLLFSQLPQIAVAGVLGYMSGELINSWMMSRLKSKTQGRLFYYRALMSTLTSQIVNCLIFFGVGFWGVMSVNTILTSAAISVGIIIIYEIFCLPITDKMCRYLKQKEGIDYFDVTSHT